MADDKIPPARADITIEAREAMAGLCRAMADAGVYVEQVRDGILRAFSRVRLPPVRSREG